MYVYIICHSFNQPSYGKRTPADKLILENMRLTPLPHSGDGIGNWRLENGVDFFEIHEKTHLSAVWLTRYRQQHPGSIMVYGCTVPLPLGGYVCFQTRVIGMCPLCTRLVKTQMEVLETFLHFQRLGSRERARWSTYPLSLCSPVLNIICRILHFL